MTLYALPLHKLDVNVEFNVSTAFVKLKGTWKNIAKYKSDCMFVLPLSGTVTGVSIKIHNRLFETLIIPKEDAQEIMQLKKDKKDNKEKLGEEDKLIDPDTNGVSGDKEGETTGQLPPMNYDEYIPNLFRLPISDVGSTDMITVSVSYIEPLQYVEGFYKFTLPLNFAKNLVKSNLKMNKVLSIKCSINSLGQETKWHCNTHKMKQVKGEGKKSALDLVVTDFEDLPQLQEKADLTREAFERDNKTEKQPLKKENPASVDWTLLYSMQSKEILPTLVCEAAEGEEEEGNFLLFVTPPSTPSEHRYGRNMVFLLDRSGSMTGQPYREASRALVHAFSSLKVSDYFTVVCFDHRI
jgi:Ca-activated chloride channel family protein